MVCAVLCGVWGVGNTGSAVGSQVALLPSFGDDSMNKRLERLKKQNQVLKEWLRAIRDCKPTEVCYDEFAYKRMIESYRDAAKNGLRKAREVKE